MPTKYGPVKTDHILFIAAGAFHVAKVADLIPELQGRFPVRVTLKPLTPRGLPPHPDPAGERLIRQYQALLKVDGVSLRFDDAPSTPSRSLPGFPTKTARTSAPAGCIRCWKAFERCGPSTPATATHPRWRLWWTRPYARARLGDECAEKDLHKYIL